MKKIETPIKIVKLDLCLMPDGKKSLVLACYTYVEFPDLVSTNKHETKGRGLATVANFFTEQQF